MQEQELSSGLSETLIISGWAFFLDYLRIKRIKIDEDQLASLARASMAKFPKWFLPEYHDGIYLLVAEGHYVPPAQDLRVLGSPIWVVTGLPSRKPTYLYTLREDGLVSESAVIPAFSTAYRRKRLFLNPNCIGADDMIPKRVLDQAGPMLAAALVAMNVEVHKQLQPVNRPIDAPATVITLGMAKVELVTSDDPVVKCFSFPLDDNQSLLVRRHKSSKLSIEVIG